MSESRIFKFLFYLLEHEHTRGEDAAKMLDVSLRTIYRDLEKLIDSGLPIYCSKGHHGGIFLNNEIKVKDHVMTKAEFKRVLEKLEGIDDVFEPKRANLIIELDTLLKQSSESWLNIDFSNWEDDTQNQEEFILLREAIINRQVVKFDYFSVKNGFSKKTVKPIKLHYKHKNWYLEAYSEKDQENRTYKIARVNNLKLTNQAYEERLESKGLSFTTKKVDPNFPEVELKFEKSIGAKVFDSFEKEQINIEQDGNLLVKFNPNPESYNDWLYGFLLSFAGKVEILGPKSLKEDFAEVVEDLYDQYK